MLCLRVNLGGRIAGRDGRLWTMTLVKEPRFLERSELVLLTGSWMGCRSHCFLLSSSSELIRLSEMDSSSQASSERILLEPYKYLLQLPGESLFWPTSERWHGDAEVLGTKLVKAHAGNADSSHFLFCIKTSASLQLKKWEICTQV